ncbi:MAG TPA: O-sialoglycoprotein endopeptidase [Bacillota bacterium]|nr:O-sialoglycoprotein endopeptidase [Bacillota bacterium]
MIVGIDTSCYTTSIALVDRTGAILLDSRKLLQVKSGQKGLRQSEAVFQHVQNLPQLLKNAGNLPAITAVIASTIPRPAEGSYLPVFNVGAAFGETLAQLCGVPFLHTSHQEGHIRAGLYGQTIPEGPFLTWHISGGTSELLLVKPDQNGFVIDKLGGSTDLHVGQFVDRVGVALGAPFPAGPFLEELALQAQPPIKPLLPVAVEGLAISFSGPASAAERLLHQGVIGSELAWGVFYSISRSLWKVTVLAAKEYHLNRVLLVGGVASNSLIRDFLTVEGEKHGIEVILGPVKLSSDNAVGAALIGYDRLNRIK